MKGCDFLQFQYKSTSVSKYCIFRSWQAESVDSGCSNCTQTSPPYPEACCGDSLHGHTFPAQAGQYNSGKVQPPPIKVSKEDIAEKPSAQKTRCMFHLDVPKWHFCSHVSVIFGTDAQLVLHFLS